VAQLATQDFGSIVLQAVICSVCSLIKLQINITIKIMGKIFCDCSVAGMWLSIDDQFIKKNVAPKNFVDCANE